MSCQMVEELGPALALDVLETSERERLEYHAQCCPHCAQDLADLRQVAAQLALTVPQQDPPRELGQRILALARADMESAFSATKTSEREARPTRPAAPERPAGERRSPWWQRWSPAFSFAALAAAIVALAWGVILQSQLAATQRQLADTSAQLERARGAYWTIVGVLASPEAEVHELQPGDAAPSAKGKVWVDPASGQGMMMARDLPQLSDEQVYQVWLAQGDSRVSSGFLRPGDGGIYYLILQAPGKLTDYQRVGVTREPSGGSPGPTGPRIIGGEI